VKAKYFHTYPIVGTESFFDGFGFNDKKYRRKFKWDMGSDLDNREFSYPPKRPLLNYMESIASGDFPMRWDSQSGKLIPNDDWFLMEQALKIENGSK